MIEREVKAVVPDAEVMRRRLAAAGTRTFAGRMADRRYDRGGVLARSEEVLRLRRYRALDGAERAVIAWKGPVAVEAGYKVRTEHEVSTPDGEAAGALLAALGYEEVQAIDRYVEYYAAAAATLRLEWYPRMDVLLEIEGTPGAIEAAIALTGMAREVFSAEALVDFVARFESRTGGPAALALVELGGASPGWPE